MRKNTIKLIRLALQVCYRIDLIVNNWTLLLGVQLKFIPIKPWWRRALRFVAAKVQKFVQIFFSPVAISAVWKLRIGKVRFIWGDKSKFETRLKCYSLFRSQIVTARSITGHLFSCFIAFLWQFFGPYPPSPPQPPRPLCASMYLVALWSMHYLHAFLWWNLSLKVVLHWFINENNLLFHRTVLLAFSI